MTTFKLIPYFSISSLLAFGLATLGLTSIYQQQSLHDLLQVEEAKNVALTSIFADSFWQEIKLFSEPLEFAHYQEIVDDPQTFVFYKKLSEISQNLSVLKVKVFNSRRKILFSTELKQIGNQLDSEDDPKLTKALSGETITTISDRENLQAFGKKIQDRKIIVSYLPIVREKKVEAVIQLYSDSTLAYQQIQQTQKRIISSIFLILSSLYLVLFLIIKQADRILTRQQFARQSAEKALAKKVTELSRSNAELEQFAYIASHDLQEPLRKIETFGDRLKAKCGNQLSEQGNDYIERMQKSARRLRTLIEDLLAFSRVTMQAQAFIFVNLNAIIDEVICDLETQIQAKVGKIEVAKLPQIEADPVQIRQLFQNLLSNALKFYRDPEAPTIAIEGTILEKSPQQWCQITVKDNGIGFDEKYSDRIFQVFQRLHGRSEYEGTGIGLAICAKIVAYHGGSITAKSTPGVGSTFIIQLPLKQAPSHLEANYDFN